MAHIISWPIGKTASYQTDEFSVADAEWRLGRLAIEANELEERAVAADDAGDDEGAGEFYAASIRKWLEYRALRAELDDYEGGFWR